MKKVIVCLKLLRRDAAVVSDLVIPFPSHTLFYTLHVLSPNSIIHYFVIQCFTVHLQVHQKLYNSYAVLQAITEHLQVILLIYFCNDDRVAVLFSCDNVSDGLMFFTDSSKKISRIFESWKHVIFNASDHHLGIPGILLLKVQKQSK